MYEPVSVYIEFQIKCKPYAVSADDLSLLGGPLERKPTASNTESYVNIRDETSTDQWRNQLMMADWHTLCTLASGLCHCIPACKEYVSIYHNTTASDGHLSTSILFWLSNRLQNTHYNHSSPFNVTNTFHLFGTFPFFHSLVSSSVSIRRKVYTRLNHCFHSISCYHCKYRTCDHCL